MTGEAVGGGGWAIREVRVGQPAQEEAELDASEERDEVSKAEEAPGTNLVVLEVAEKTSSSSISSNIQFFQLESRLPNMSRSNLMAISLTETSGGTKLESSSIRRCEGLSWSELTEEEYEAEVPVELRELMDDGR